MELAAIKAFLEVHPGVKIVLCFFHFRKTLRDNLSKKKITVEANKNRRFNKLYRMVCSLAFVPPSHTINVADTVIVLYLNKHCTMYRLGSMEVSGVKSNINSSKNPLKYCHNQNIS